VNLPLNVDPAEINRLVDEVVKRLRGGASTHQPLPAAQPPQATAQPPQATAQPPQATQTPAAVPPPANVLRLPDSVITLDLLRNRLTGVDTVETSAGAVITPAVRDELNIRSIKLAIYTRSSAPKRSLVVGVADCKHRVDAMLQPLQTEVSHRGEVSEVVTALQNAVAAGGVAVLFCSQPFKATIAANRCETTFAAHVATLADAQQAAAGAEANLLVIDPSRSNPVVIRQILQLLQNSDAGGS